ncbi:hypothetical protein BGW41_007080 [Actinomortierella wolfii]|nr:hypothetical protein BGW41_007080 [Actinomortierella wolfii]
MNSGPRISVWTSSSSTRTATLASTNASILGDEAESRPPSASYSVGTSDVKEQRESVSVFGEQLANGMFNKNNPGGLFGYSREEEKRLVRKIDYRLLPILGTFYAFSTLNRANLTNARIFAYESALHATNEQYTWAIAMFYCGFGLAEIPSIFALLYLTPKIWLPLSMFACEQTFRLAILSLFNSASGAFGGLVAGAIGLLHGVAGLDGWQWVFILESIPTAICAVTAYFILAKTPEAAPWLNQRETSIAIYRIRNDTKIKVNRTFSKKTIMTAVKDPKVYLFMSLNLILTSLRNGSSLNAAYHVQVQDHMYKTPPPPSLFLWNPTLMADTDVLLPLRRRQISSSTTLMAKLPHTTKLPSPRYPNPRKPRPTSAPSPSPRPSPSGIPFMPRGSTVSTVPSNSTVNNNNNNNKTSTINSPPKNTATPEPDSDDETMLPPIDTTSPPDPGVAAAFEEMTVRARILAQLLSSPPYFFGGLLTFAVAVIVDRTQQRAYMIVALSFFTICGYACELITTNVHARYTASFIIYAGQSAMMPVATSWLTTNVGGYAKRAIAVAIYQLGASLAGVMGSQYYRTKHAPRYVVGHSVNIGFLIVLIGCTALQRWRLARANYRRSYSVAFGLNPIRGLSKAEIRDLGDNHPAYRYTL